MEAIQNSYAGLKAATESDNTDNYERGMRNYFKSSAAHLVPYNLVQKKRSNNNKCGAGDITEVNGENSQVSEFIEKQA